MNLKDEHTSRLWTFIVKGEIMDLDDHELIATRINNKAANWKEVEEYIEKYYVKKDKIREKIKLYKQLELNCLYRDSIQADEYRACMNVLKELLD